MKSVKSEIARQRKKVAELERREKEACESLQNTMKAEKAYNFKFKKNADPVSRQALYINEVMKASNKNLYFHPDAQDQSPIAPTQASSRKGTTYSKKSNTIQKQRDSILSKSTANEDKLDPFKQHSAPTTIQKHNIVKKTKARETQRTHGPGEKAQQ